MEEVKQMYNDELYHYGVKGQKWGVRRYQNKDGSLTPAGKKRVLKEEYKKVGASKSLTKRYIGWQDKDVKTVNKVTKALDRLDSGDSNPKYTDRQRAKDYDTAIRGMTQLRDRQVLRAMREHAEYQYLNNKLTRLEDKTVSNPKRQERINKKIKTIMTDQKLARLGIHEAGLRYGQNAAAVDALVKRMSNDKSVVYTTRRRIHAEEEAGPVQTVYGINSTGGSSVGGAYSYNSLSSTDYKVKANTKRRSNSKKYNDPNRKKQYRSNVTRTDVYYV